MKFHWEWQKHSLNHTESVLNHNYMVFNTTTHQLIMEKIKKKNYVSKLQQNQASGMNILSEIPSLLWVVCKIRNAYKQCFEQTCLVCFSVGSLRGFFVQWILAKTGHAENHQEKKLLLENLSDSKLLMAQSSWRNTSQLDTSYGTESQYWVSKTCTTRISLLMPCLVFLVHVP